MAVEVEVIGAFTTDQIPYLQPEIVLLTKALRRRDMDEQDFSRVLPRLNLAQCQQLADDIQKMQPDHPWMERLQGWMVS